LGSHFPADAAGLDHGHLIRIIFKLKLADIIINVTAGGPGGATDSVTSFIFREYRDRSNVGYGTCLPWSIWCSSSSR
jgi:ABC-type sugar transport system permease subunit